MLTEDKTITTPSYWDKVYSGKNDNAKQDASNNVRPKNAFDRFKWVADLAEGTKVLGVASGHARIEKLIKANHPEWVVVASDQAKGAQGVANYDPYLIVNAYDIPFPRKEFNTIIATQCLEYMEDVPRFLYEARRVARKLITTAPLGEMAKWSQLYVFDEGSLKTLLMQFGAIEVEDIKEDIMLYKIKFHES